MKYNIQYIQISNNNNIMFIINCLLLLTIATTILTHVIQLTQSNINLLLHSSSEIVALLHHPQCQYSINYKSQYLKYTQNNNNNNNNVETTRGIIDCSTNLKLCQKYNIQYKYPKLIKIYNKTQSDNNVNKQYQVIDQQKYLITNTLNHNNIRLSKYSDQYLTNLIINKLKQQPNYIVVLFQEIGMPVQDHDLISKTSQFRSRVFYMEINKYINSRLINTLSGFVGDKGGCWIYYYAKKLNGGRQLEKYYCGDTYQGKKQLQGYLKRFNEEMQTGEENKRGNINKLLVDDSNYESDLIMGYKQLHYKLQHYSLQLQNLAPKSPTISPHYCSYLYLWHKQCQFCNYPIDIKIIQSSIQNHYNNIPKSKGYINYQITSYDINVNKAIWRQSTIRNIMFKDTDINNNTQSIKQEQQLLIVPNLLAICYSDKNQNQNQGQNQHNINGADLFVKRLDQSITRYTIQKFVKEVQQQYKIKEHIIRASQGQQQQQL